MTEPTLYDDSPDPRWSDEAMTLFTVTPTPSPENPYLFDLVGTCPRCRDHMEAEYWLINFAGVAPMDREDMIRTADAIAEQALLPTPSRRQEFAIRCNCDGGHKKRNGEAAERGCGASWVMAVELP